MQKIQKMTTMVLPDGIPFLFFNRLYLTIYCNVILYNVKPCFYLFNVNIEIKSFYIPLLEFVIFDGLLSICPSVHLSVYKLFNVSYLFLQNHLALFCFSDEKYGPWAS